LAQIAAELDRRDLLRRAVYLVGGAAALSAFAGGQSWAADSPPFFSIARMALLSAVADTMMPATDTPGAVEAGAPQFVDSMMTKWASEATRTAVNGTLDMIDAAALAEANTPFVGLSVRDRLGVLAAYDKSAVAMEDSGYLRLKELILTGYYLSETGATKELCYIHRPGAWKADIPFSDIGRAWAVG
jgi:hypothetical protein